MVSVPTRVASGTHLVGPGEVHAANRGGAPLEGPTCAGTRTALDSTRIEHVMFEAADPAVFAWYIKNYGAEVNLFVDHSQIVQLECLRSGIWGTKSLWGRVLTYKG